MNVDRLIDRFVETINRSEREPKWAEEIPADLRIDSSDIVLQSEERKVYDWQIQRADQVDRTAAFEAQFAVRFPRSFRSLITRYRYPDLTVGPLWLFANTGEDIPVEMSRSLVCDSHLTAPLLQNGYLPFARPESQGYDPICFDTRRRSSGEYPIVRIDHEAVLCYNRVRVVETIAPSFVQIVLDFLSDRAQA